MFEDFETQFAPLFYLLSKYRFKHWSRKDIKAYQLKKRRDIVRYAKSNSKFFKNYYDGIDNFLSLPTVNKEIMMNNLSDYNTLGFDKKNLAEFALEVEKTRDFSKRYKGVNIGMSSGTSGNKGIVITTKREENYLKAVYASRLVRPRGEKLNAAFILRVSSPAFNYNRFGNRLTYISQLQSIGKIIEDLERIGPNIIAAPPSMLRLLANKFLEDDLRVEPKLLYSYAEVLHKKTKKYLENSFACEVHEVYQGSEGSYAMTCEEGNLHINEDLVYFELLDKNGNPTPDGEPCYKLLVTDLHKRSQPIIRYELNDILTLSNEECECGSKFKMIKEIQGRTNDLFWGIRNDKKQFIYQDYIVRAIISVSDNIQNFQAIQDDFTDVKIVLKVNSKENIESLKKKVAQNIKGVFAKYECTEPQVEVKIGEPQPNERSNKLIRVISNMNLNEKK